MQIDKAIKILTTMQSPHWSIDSDDKDAALQLGIEALERCKLVAEGYQYWHERPLPGETEK